MNTIFRPFQSIFFLLLLSIISSCSKQGEISEVATLFAPGRISSKMPEFATTVNQDENELYFNRTSADRSSIFIMQAKKEGQKWSKPKPVSFSNGQYRDVDPFLSHDGKRLYFSSDRPLEAGYERGVFNTWFVEKTYKGWSLPINPGTPLNTDYTEIFITLAQNGNAYFVSERNGERMIMRCRNINGRYARSERIDLEMNGYIIYASNPCIASDESFIIVAAKDPLGDDNVDLYISRNLGEVWSILKNLGPSVNSPYADFAPGLSKDDKTLYFTSERPGIVGKQEEGKRPPSDIYVVNLEKLLSSEDFE